LGGVPRANREIGVPGGVSRRGEGVIWFFLIRTGTATQMAQIGKMERKRIDAENAEKRKPGIETLRDSG
jgi:hypothetical protein